MKLKNYVKQHRARLNITQKDLANRTGVSRQTINSIETGKYIPSALVALKIAEALKMKFDDLFELIRDKEDRESFIDRIQKSRFDN